MSITTKFDFSNPSDYTLTDIDISGAMASLSLVSNPGQTFSQPLTSSTGFSFDSSKTSISGGVLSQVDLRPANATFFAAYDNSINANWGNGSLTASNNGSVLGTDVLQLLGGVSTKYIDYSATANAQSTQVGCVRLIYIPNYSGTPSTYQLMYRACQGIGSENNLVAFFHNITGTLSIRLFDASASSIISADFGAFSPVAGTRYEIELNWDITSGATRLFVDGTQLGSTLTQTGTRTSNIGLIRIGEDSTLIGASAYANFSITNVLVFSTVQHTSNYSAPSPVPSSTAFSGDTIVFPIFSYSGLGDLVDFSGFTTASDVNAPGYILNNLFWDGMDWVSSDGTYSETNTKAQIIANIDSLPNNDVLEITVVTQSGSSAMSITGPLVVTYSGQIYPIAGGTIRTNAGVNAQSIASFAATLSESGSDTITFALIVNNTLMYWNGSAWATSDGTFSKTNTASIINTHCSTLLSVNSVVKLFALLVSGDGSTTPSLTDMTIQYSFGAVAPSAPATTIVYGFLSDIQGNPVSNVTITFSLISVITNGYMETSSHVLLRGSVATQTDSNGYFEQPVIATTQFQGTNTFIQVSITKGSITEDVGADGGPLYLTIPQQFSVDITSLLSA